MSLAALAGEDGIVYDFASRSPHSKSQQDSVCPWIVHTGGSELRAGTIG